MRLQFAFQILVPEGKVECACVGLVKPTMWGPNVTTKIVIPVIFDLVEYFF